MVCCLLCTQLCKHCSADHFLSLPSDSCALLAQMLEVQSSYLLLPKMLKQLAAGYASLCYEFLTKDKVANYAV